MSESASIARFGYVSDYDPARHMARIQFPDKDNLISGWIPVSVRNSLRNHDEHHLDIGEHVFCVMQGNGLESGCVVCAVYDDTNKSYVGDKDKRAINFSDGTSIIYDRANNELNVNSVKNINLTAGEDITITAKKCNINFTDGACISYDSSSQEMNITSRNKIFIRSSEIIEIEAGSIIKISAPVIEQ